MSDNISQVINTLVTGLHTLSKSETIIGDAYQLGDATLVPVHRLRVGLGAGALSAGGQRETSKGESGGSGAGGTVQLEPVAVIAVGRDGVPRILTVEPQSENVLQGIINQLPEVAGRALKLLSDRLEPLANKVAKPTEVSAAAEPAKLPAAETKALGS